METQASDRTLDIELARLWGCSTWYHEGYDAWALNDPSGGKLTGGKCVFECFCLTEEDAWLICSPHFTSSLDAHIPVWREIEKRGLIEPFVIRLATGEGIEPRSLWSKGDRYHYIAWFQLICCRPEQLTRAAIATLKEAHVES